MNYTFSFVCSLGMDQLIGSNVLKPYMHGFFVDLQLYEKVRLLYPVLSYSNSLLLTSLSI